MRRTTNKNAFPVSPSEMADPLAEMARIRVVHALSQQDGSLEGTVEELLDQSLAENPTGWSEATRNVMRGVVEGLSDREDANQRIRSASETAVLAVAKRWGNIVSAGKATVTATREAAGRTGIDSTLAAQQASLGAMEGALQAGPIVYPLLQQELSPIVEDFEGVMTRERRSFYVDQAPHELPTIVRSFESSEYLDDLDDGAIVETSVETFESMDTEDAAALVRRTLLEDFDDDTFESEPGSAQAETAQGELGQPEEHAPVQSAKSSLWQSVKNWLTGLFSKKR